VTRPKIVTLPDTVFGDYYSPPSSIDARGTFSLAGDVISIKEGTPSISSSYKIDEPFRQPVPGNTTAYVSVAGRELLLDGWKDNRKVAEQICYYASEDSDLLY